MVFRRVSCPRNCVLLAGFRTVRMMVGSKVIVKMLVNYNCLVDNYLMLRHY